MPAAGLLPALAPVTHRVSAGTLAGKNLCSVPLGAAREHSTATMGLLCSDRQLCCTAWTEHFLKLIHKYEI